MIQKLLRLAALAIFLGLAGCVALPSHVASEFEDARPGEANIYASVKQSAPSPAAAARGTPRATAPSKVTLVSGQILVRDDGDPISLWVSLFAGEFMPWTHVGIISVEADDVYVYDTRGGLPPVAGVVPTLLSGMRRTPYEQYVSSAKVFGIYAPPPAADAGKIAAYAREHFARGTPFDSYFDNTDANALYCSELVAAAVQAAGAAPIQQAPVRVNRSYNVIREWLQQRASGFFLPAHFVDPTRKIALWSTALSPAQIEAQFEARHELAQRFTASTRLGHLFRWTGATLALREAPQQFMDSTSAAFASGATSADDTESVRREVRRLAALHFSERPGSATALAPANAR